jgi:hypothetical protein
MKKKAAKGRKKVKDLSAKKAGSVKGGLADLSGAKYRSIK